MLVLQEIASETPAQILREASLLVGVPEYHLQARSGHLPSLHHAIQAVHLLPKSWQDCDLPLCSTTSFLA